MYKAAVLVSLRENEPNIEWYFEVVGSYYFCARQVLVYYEHDDLYGGDK